MSEMPLDTAMSNGTAVICVFGDLSVGRYPLDVFNSDTNLVCEAMWIQVVPAAVVMSAISSRVHGGDVSALVTLMGYGFVQTSSLSCFNGRERSDVVEFLNSTAVVCSVKNDSFTSGKILVGASNIEACDVNCSVFVDIVGVSVVTAVNPSSGFSRGGQRITLTGQFLQSSISCVFDGISSPVIEFGSSFPWIVCLLPSGLDTQSVRVWVSPYGHAAGSALFRILPMGRVISVMPTWSIISGGSTVTVYGQDLSIDGSDVSCYFGNLTLVRGSRVIDSGTIECVVPPYSFSGLVELRLQMSLQDVHWGYLALLYVDVPVITMIVPSFGPSSGGTIVSVVGFGFTEVPSSSWSMTVSLLGQTLRSNCANQAHDTLLCSIPATFQEGNWSVQVCEGDLCSEASTFFQYLPTSRKLRVLTPVVEAVDGRSVVVSVQVSSAAYCQHLLCRIGLSSAQAPKNP
jgi:hypothetical protein